ncbi:hypothetical protein TI39_contig285g00026 [Zymoseptoria brevis]|uniref:XPG-I domain-containing protein n=1 Tax=Zymoseptoria brevis TaxID=1047168 RepID=A0A0F4GWH3_9PEZI|nr:hypothetical protein TI39_contig285g00026 [Zymoseptoria brevis]
MGINGLWDVLGEGEIWHIADYAAAHFKEHKRPLRIAVDEATWRFTNLTPEQTERIREGEPAANPQEKVILWRILRQWRLNIQYLFVTDGLKKPWKAGRHGKGPGGGKMDEQCIKLLHQMFDLLKVHYHRAPGEGEAECARLQQLGIVDAVWSDDCDAFMFGCTTLIKQHKVGQKRVEDHIRVYKASTILEQLDMDADSLVLFALLSGGDYDETGLRGCGPQLARVIAKKSLGLATQAKYMPKEDLPRWRAALSEALRAVGKEMEIPPTFPKLKALDGYRAPSVSTDEQCHNLRALRRGWDLQIDQPKLRIELRHRYNFSTREYLKHLAPAFLAQKLARTSSEQGREENLSFGVELKPVRHNKNVDPNGPGKCEVRIMVSAADLVEVDLSVQPPEEDWTKFAAKDGTPYSPHEKIECYLLDCLLRNGLPERVFDAPAESPKRKSRSRAAAKASQDASQDAPASSLDHAVPAGSDSSVYPPPAVNLKKRAKAPKDSAGAQKPSKKKRKSEEVIEEPSSPPRPAFRRPDVPTFAKPAAKPLAKVGDLCDDDDDDDNDEPALAWSSKITAGDVMPCAMPNLVASGLSSTQMSSSQPDTRFDIQDSQGLSGAKHWSTKPAAQRASSTRPPDNTSFDRASSRKGDLIPGESIAPATVRELRLANLLRNNATVPESLPESMVKPPNQHREDLEPRRHVEVVDLT